MATCFHCDQEISYLTYLLSGFTNFRVNFGRASNPVVTCKHCGGHNVQQTISLVGGVLLIFVGGIGFVFLAEKMGDRSNGQGWSVGLLPLLFFLQYIWWKFFTRLREP